MVAVLLVNDHEAQRYALARTLEQAGYLIRAAATGREALAMAAEIPDVIVLDVGLPDMTGYDVCCLLKEDTRTANIPVIFLSATYQSGHSREMGEQAGGSAYLFDPVDAGTLVAVIEGTLARQNFVSAGKTGLAAD